MAPDRLAMREPQTGRRALVLIAIAGTARRAQAGFTFWLRWNTLAGSQTAFSAASRASFAGG